MRRPIPIPYSVKPLKRLAGIKEYLGLGAWFFQAPSKIRVPFSTRYEGILEPSVAQPPFPLQEFFPLQPLSLVLQPPLPLQEFWPLQACFSFLLLKKEES